MTADQKIEGSRVLTLLEYVCPLRIVHGLRIPQHVLLLPWREPFEERKMSDQHSIKSRHGILAVPSVNVQYGQFCAPRLPYAATTSYV
jgi:hypothetical protein